MNVVVALNAVVARPFRVDNRRWSPHATNPASLVPAPLTVELTVERELRGLRIDSFLVRHFRNYTPWRMQRIVRAGQATLNQAPASETDRVFTGQVVRITLIEPPDKLLADADADVPVFHEDPWILVVDKPAGMIAHPTGAHQNGTLANVLQHRLNRSTTFRGMLRPGLVHRLDRQTTGVMVVAIHHLSHRRLSEAFELGRVSKTYVALVQGDVAADSGIIDLPIGRARTGKCVLMSARGDALEARPSRTRYEVVQRFGDYTLVRAFPATGRNHQIRVHFAQVGHPLVGDEFYEAFGKIKPIRMEGDGDAAGETGADGIETGLPIRRHALHAERLCFGHPISGAWMEFRAPLPEDLRRTVALLSDRRVKDCGERRA
jgi:23S rRNA pseudouridine1911/1915/1917 synthase